MSNLPPPSSGGAPYQPEQPTVAFNPLPPIGGAPPAQKKSKGRLIAIVVAAVVVVAALVVGALLVFGGDDDGGGKVDTAAASGAVEDSTTAAKLDRTTNVAILEECPFDGIDDLADDAPKGFDAATAAKGDDQAAITQTDERADPLLLQCITANDDASLVYGVTAAAIPPTELQDYISRTLTSGTPKFETSSSFRGGTLLPFCTTSDDRSDDATCATAWYDKQLMAAIFATGDGSSTDVTTAWIKDELDDIVDDLAGADADKVEVAQTVGFDLDASGAAANLGAMLDAADVGAAGAQADQASCVVAEFDTVLAAAPSALDRSTLSGAVFNSISRPDEDGDPAFALCADASEDNTNQIGILVAEEAPADFEAYVKRSSGSDDVTFGDTVDFRGGTLHPYCVNGDAGVAFCETDWLADGIQVGAFLAFDGVTADDATTLLDSTIDAILATTAATDASTITPAG